MNEQPTRITFDAAALDDDQRDGLACVTCRADLAHVASVPVGHVAGGQVFACKTHRPACEDCGTVEYRYIDLDNDTARMDCPRDHPFPTAEPMTPEGAQADAELRERAARRATWPDGEPGDVRQAADLVLKMRDTATQLRALADEMVEPVASIVRDVADAQDRLCDVVTGNGDLEKAADLLEALTAQARDLIAQHRAVAG